MANTSFIAALVASAVASGAFAAAATAEPIRPSKMLTAESAAAIPAGSTLMSFAGSNFNLAYGLMTGVQLELGVSGAELLGSSTKLPLKAMAKAVLFEAGPVAVGAGIGGNVDSLALSSAWSGQIFLPVSAGLAPGVGLNVVPRYATDASGGRLGADLGLSFAIAPNWTLFAEDRLADFGNVAHHLLLGAGFGGFGPSTSLGFGVFSGAGTPASPHSLGFGAALHQGF